MRQAWASGTLKEFHSRMVGKAVSRGRLADTGLGILKRIDGLTNVREMTPVGRDAW